MKNFIYTLLFPATIFLSLTNCSKDDDSKSTAAPVVVSPVEGKLLVAEGTIDAADVSVKLYADEALFVGYNRLYVLLYQKGTSKLVKNAHVYFKPIMDMGTMTHSCPVENPSETPDEKGVFKGASIFIMKSTGMGKWQMVVEVDNLSNQQSGEVTLDITVTEKATPRLFSFVSETDATAVFVSMLEPSYPVEGMNDFEITIHYRANKDLFPPMKNVTVLMDPEMPTMGHGSPNNEHPVHMENGHYLGKVNFTMPGYWKINLNFRDSDGHTLKDSMSFDLTF